MQSSKIVFSFLIALAIAGAFWWSHRSKQTPSAASAAILPAPNFDLRALASSANVTLSWKAASGAQTYVVYIYEASDPEREKNRRALQTNRHEIILTDLKAGVPYLFALTAVIDGQETAPSAVVVAKVGLPVNAKTVVAGEAHACAIRSDGKVICWGANEAGQVGDGSKTTWSLPVLVPNVDEAVGIKIFRGQTCVTRKNAHETCWGPQADGSSQRSFGCTEKKGHILCQGDNDFGQLGSDFLKEEKFKRGSVAVGARFACAINSREQIFCWGANDVGQMGNGSGHFSSAPQPVVF